MASAYARGGMGLLDKMWDDVLAGPKPSEGLGKLRRKIKQAADAEDAELQRRRQSAEFQQFQREAQRVVSKSIPVPKRPSPLEIVPNESSTTSSLPSTPSGMSPLMSPSMSSPASRMRQSLFRQSNSALATPSDLMVISALDK